MMESIWHMSRYQKCLLFLMIGLFTQFYTIPLFGTHLKMYMVCSVLILIILGFSVIGNGKLLYERIWIFSYLSLALSIIWANNIALALQLILGEIILLTFYFVLKSLLELLSIDEVEQVFDLSFRFFVYVSLVLYVMGFVSIYVLHSEITYAVHLNEGSLRIFGCYKEGMLPRFMGLAESPNNYAYFADMIFWFFVWKGKTKEAVITLLTLIFTISTTLYLALVVQVCCFYFLGGRLTWKVVLLCFGLYGGFVFLIHFPEVQAIMDDRMIRNATGSGRFELWEYSLNKISESPIVGFGINQSRTLFTKREYLSSHNNILEMGLSLGYIGCIVYIVFLLSLLKSTFSFSKNTKIPFVAQISVAYFIFGFANNTLHIEYTVFIIVLLSYYIRRLSYLEYV